MKNTGDIEELFKLLNDEQFRKKATKSELIQIESLIDQLNETKRYYGITSFQPQAKQQIFVDQVRSSIMGESPLTYFLFWGGNRGGKSIGAAYICSLLALGRDGKKYGLPYIGRKKRIYVYTKTGQNLKDVMLPYFLGDYSLVGIPRDEIEKSIIERGRLKEIHLKNGSTINFLTYDQRRENIQGGTPDFIWCDEEPTDNEVWNEIYARSTSEGCHTIVTMTPLGQMTGLYKQLIDNPNKDWQDKFVFNIQVFGVLDNEYSNKDGIDGWTPEQKNRRIYGSWNPPEGLVYANFTPSNILTNESNMRIHMEPTFSNMDEPVKYYYGIDPGGTHPHAFVGLARTESGIWYQFYEGKFKNNEPVATIAAEVKRLCAMYPPEKIICDSQAKAYRRELLYHGVKTDKADKRSKLNDAENREAGIRLLNDLFFNGNFFISGNCIETEKEYKSHYYKLGKDGSTANGVRKVNDDLLDAVRYPITEVEIWEQERKRKSASSSSKKKDRKNLMKGYNRSKYGEFVEYNT